MNLVKTTLRNRLTSDSLNSMLLVLLDCHYKVFMMNILKNVLITGLTKKIVVKVNVNVICIKDAKVRRQNDPILTFQKYHQNPRALPIHLHQKMKL